MKSSTFSVLVIFFISYVGCQNNGVTVENPTVIQQSTYSQTTSLNNLKDISVPDGYKRDTTSHYGKWMRNLALNKDNTVYYYNGGKKPNQSIHVAVLDFDIGKRDLQQCADACMRIRAEYLFEQKRFSEITFLLASGKWKSFTDYTSKRDYKSFRKYMNYIFAFANTSSLEEQLKPVTDIQDIQLGDVWVQSRSPYGHAVTVMDVCVDSSGNKRFMLSQSYMTAQSIEILINPNFTNKNPWYPVNFEGDLITPEWTFSKKDLRRF